MKRSLVNRKFIRQIGIASDHAGFDLKNYVKKKLAEKGYKVIDFGDIKLEPSDDYPDYVIPMVLSVASKKLNKGIAICGSGVGACIAANKVKGVRACLINEKFSAKQGVEDDDMNVICLGARVITHAKALKLVTIFLDAEFSSKARHKRRIAKVKELEKN